MEGMLTTFGEAFDEVETIAAPGPAERISRAYSVATASSRLPH